MATSSLFLPKSTLNCWSIYGLYSSGFYANVCASVSLSVSVVCSESSVCVKKNE